MLVKLLSKIDYSFLLHSTPSPILYPIYKNSDNKELSPHTNLSVILALYSVPIIHEVLYKRYSFRRKPRKWKALHSSKIFTEGM